MEDNKIQCEVCFETECYKETEAGIDSYLCMHCGYTTTSENVDGSIHVRKIELTTPELIKQSRFVDPNNLVWYPSVLNFPSKGLVFPDGTNETNWKWRVAKMVDIPEAEQIKYPIPGQDKEYYKTRIDMQNSIEYDRYDFASACVDLGILQKEEK